MEGKIIRRIIRNHRPDKLESSVHFLFLGGTLPVPRTPSTVRGTRRRPRLPSRCRCTWTRLPTPCRRQAGQRSVSGKRIQTQGFWGAPNGPPASAPELVQQRHHLPRSGAAQRVAQRDGAPVRIHLLWRNAQLLHTVHSLGGGGTGRFC